MNTQIVYINEEKYGKIVIKIGKKQTLIDMDI